MSSPKPIYIQKSNHHAKIHAYLIVDIIDVPDTDGKNFTVVGRLLPKNSELETKSFDYVGFDETCKRPVIGDMHYQTIDCDTGKVTDRGGWNTMENFEKYWELQNAYQTLGVEPPLTTNRIVSIDLRPLLPTKEDPFFRNAPAHVVLQIEAPPTWPAQYVKIPADVFRRFNPKLGHHYFVEGGKPVFYTPEEFTRLVFTTFNAKRPQEQ